MPLYTLHFDKGYITIIIMYSFLWFRPFKEKYDMGINCAFTVSNKNVPLDQQFSQIMFLTCMKAVSTTFYSQYFTCLNSSSY